MMEKKTIRSGAPFLAAGLGVLLASLVLGLGSAVGYVIALAAGAAGFALGRKAFPDWEIEVERAPQSGSEQADELIEQARAQLGRIMQANVAIADPALSAQIDDIEKTCRKILARLEEKPEMLSSLRTFLRYYLPVTLRLLNARANMEGEVASGENARIAQKVASAVAQIQAAFHKQLEALDEFRFMDLESEMDVLSDMLRGDGLIQEEDAQQPAVQEDDPFSSLFAKGKEE